MRRSNRGQVGPREVRAGAEEGLIGELRHGVAQAIPEVQPGAVPALAVAAVGVGRGLPVRVSKRNDGKLGFHDEEGEEALAVGADARRQHHARFGEGWRADSRGRALRQPIEQSLPSRLPKEDRNENRGIDDQTPSGP